MPAERVVGWVSEQSARHPIGIHGVVRLDCGALTCAVRSPLGSFELLLLLPPGLEACCAGQRVDTATVLRPGESLRTGDATAGARVEFTLAAEFGTAGECRADRCEVCGDRLDANAPVARCPVCGVVACMKLCASAHQCTQCGAVLEESWV